MSRRSLAVTCAYLLTIAPFDQPMTSIAACSGTGAAGSLLSCDERRTCSTQPLRYLKLLAALDRGRLIAGVELGGAVKVGEGLVVAAHLLVGLPAASDSPGVAGVKLDRAA